MKQAIPRCALAVCLGGASLLAYAADHAESPTVTADPAADIADVFIFRPDQSANRLVAAITFAGRPCTAPGSTCGPNSGGSAPVPVGGTNRIDGPTLRCDRNVLYVLNIDNNADGNFDTTADIKVQARLARNGNDQCGVQIENIPGTAGPLRGRSDTVITDTASGLRAYAGLVEDPFFFDTVGFGETLASFAADGPSGALRFMNSRDGFGGRNLSVIVFEMDLGAATGGNPTANPVIQFWGDTFRFPGTQP